MKKVVNFIAMLVSAGVLALVVSTIALAFGADEDGSLMTILPIAVGFLTGFFWVPITGLNWLPDGTSSGWPGDNRRTSW